MGKARMYVSKQADDEGFINWSEEENQTWQALIERQLDCVQGKACDEYMQGLEKLNLPTNRIPQLSEVNQVLMVETGWQCTQVPALIGFEKFFRLLSQKQFPVATFIRSKEEFDYLQEPDIFHEIFGHCAMLTNPAFANFTQAYGQLGLKASKEDRVFLARLYWFTVEFGLMQTPQGLRIYGGGVLSSPGETDYAMCEGNAERRFLTNEAQVLDVLRTPYRIDIMQPIYFMIEKMSDLDAIRALDLMSLVSQAKTLGLHAPKFSKKNAPPSNKLAS